MHEPINQHHTAVAGPPADSGAPNVAGTEPSTPRMEMAYETVDHLENSRRSSWLEVHYQIVPRYDRHKGLGPQLPAYTRCEPAKAHHHPE